MDGQLLEFSKDYPVFEKPMPSFKIIDYVHDQVSKQDQLLTEAKSGNEVSASSLLLLYASYQGLVSPEIATQIETGMRNVTAKIVEAKTLRNGRAPEIGPLSYFGFERAPTRSEGESAKANELVKLRYAYGMTLSHEQIVEALTTEFATTKEDSRRKAKSKLSREEWPSNIGRMEQQLTEYVQHKFKGSDEGFARRLARRSLDMDWDSPNRPIRYPAAF